jgi:hypothetical protein
MISLKITKTVAAYLAGSAALAGGAAQGAVIYQAFGQDITDPDATVVNSGSVLAAIHFDGTSITSDATPGSGAFVLTADDVSVDSTTTKVATVDGSRSTAGTYLQTLTAVSPGSLIASGFTSASAPVVFTGTATDQIIGVQTTAGNLGWVRFSFTTDGAAVTLKDAAFESVAGQAVTAGVVPESSTMALLALAGGAVALRRRRAA